MAYLFTGLIIFNDNLPDYGAYEKVFKEIKLGIYGNSHTVFQIIVDIVGIITDNYYEQRVILLLIELGIISYIFYRQKIEIDIIKLISITSIVIEYVYIRLRAGIGILIAILVINFIKNSRELNKKVLILLTYIIVSSSIHLETTIIIASYISIFYVKLLEKKIIIENKYIMIIGIISIIQISIFNNIGSSLNIYRVIAYLIIPVMLFLGYSKGYEESKLILFKSSFIVALFLLILIDDKFIGDGENISRILSLFNALLFMHLIYYKTNEFDKLCIVTYSIISSIFILKYLII